MNHSERIANLLFRYMREELTEAEKAELSEWRTSSEENELFFQHETNPENIRREMAELYKGRERTFKKIIAAYPDIQPTPRRARYGWLKIAALLMVVLGAGLYIYWQRHDTAPAIPMAAENIPPGSHQAVLILSSGRSVSLDSSKALALSGEAEYNMVQVSNGELRYLTGTANTGSISNTLVTPRGGQYQLTLSDGTRVWLNAASSIRYPPAFTASKREVELTGEAYFEVARNASSPFIVHTGNVNVQVLGTHFNVMAYGDEPGIETTLLEGSVRVSTSNKSGKPADGVVLHPGQQVRVQGNQINNVQMADTVSVIAWTNGKTSFKDASIPTILRAVSRWYDVDIIYQGNIPEKKLRGGISRYTPLSEVITVLENNGIHCTVKNKTITVTP